MSAKTSEPSLVLFLHAKPVKLIVSLKKGPEYATHLSKDIDCTYSHTVKLLDQFKRFGLVDFEKKGRIKIVKLTQTGEDIAAGFDGVIRQLNKVK